MKKATLQITTVVLFEYIILFSKINIKSTIFFFFFNYLHLMIKVLVQV